MRYIGILALLVALGVAATMTAQGLKRAPSGTTYQRAVGAAQDVSNTAVQHVKDVLQNVNAH